MALQPDGFNAVDARCALSKKGASRWACWGAMLMLSMLAACGGGDGDSSSLAGSGSVAAGGGAGRPSGLYQTWFQGSETVYNTICGVDGFCSNYPSVVTTFEYEYLFFNDNGYVHVGSSSDLNELTCSRGAGSSESCKTYEIQGASIRVGDESPTSYEYHAETGVLEIGGYDNAFTHIKPAAKGQRISGVFKNTDCSGSTCSRTSLGFKADGTFWMLGSSTMFAGIGFGTATGSGSSELRGTYVMDGYSITLTSSNGKSVTNFLSLSLDEKSRSVQMGDTIYSEDDGS